LIGVVTTSYPRESGDPAGHFVAGFARWLRDRGSPVEVIAAGPGSEVVDGIPVERIDGRGLFYGGGAPDALDGASSWIRAARFQAELALTAARRRKRWNAVVSHWLAPSGIATALALRGSKTRHLAIAHSSDVALLRRSKFGRALVRWLAKNSDLVYTAPHLVLDGAPGRVVPMGIDAAPPGDRARGRKRFLLQRTTALFLGRLVPVKGVDLLLRALPDGLDLVVAGEGPMAERWRALAAPLGARVRFLGEVRGADKQDLLAAADFLCLPSVRLPDGRTEGAPTVLAEALAAGLPIVATWEAGAAQLIRDGETGLIVAAQQSPLRAALARLAADPSLRERFSDAAREAGRAHLWPSVGPTLASHILAPA
jgi:glycosyltransferase involved in cell wall biosynthesis